MGSMLTFGKRALQPELLAQSKDALTHGERMDLARRIAVARIAKGWTQRDLAKKIGVSPGAVGQWETGDKQPSIANRGDLSKALGVPFLEFLPEFETVTGDDKEVAILVEKFRSLPPRVRESILMHVSYLFDAMPPTPSERTQTPSDRRPPATKAPGKDDQPE